MDDSSSAPVDSTPVEAAVAPEEASAPAVETPEAPSAPEVPEATSEAPEASTEAAPPEGDSEGNAEDEEKARVLAEEAAKDDEKVVKDLSPEEEVAASTDSRIDGSNIGQTTNTEATASLPTNDQGQVEIDENGHVVGT